MTRSQRVKIIEALRTIIRGLEENPEVPKNIDLTLLETILERRIADLEQEDAKMPRNGV